MNLAPSPHGPHRQSDYALRMDWGPTGAEAIAPGCDVAVVVDVLSFTTTLSVAADRGVAVFPYPWRDDGVVRFAADRDAVVAVGRSEAGAGQASLSPGSVRAVSSLTRLVLPSPNGSAISFQLAQAASSVVGACLRNRDAIAAWLFSRRAEDPALRVAVVASGERWPDSSLRPAAEDLWGAGAVIDALIARGWRDMSPEARAAAAAYRAAADDLASELRCCASGRELIEAGYPDDVDVAAELDSSRVVPLLEKDAFHGI